MQKIKRTASINRTHFRKTNTTSSRQSFPQLKYLTLLIATCLAGCSNHEEAKVVTSVADCINNTDFSKEECETAYQQALAESEKSAPQYSSLNQCETEFGPQQCTQSSSGFFMPFMAGFLVSSLLDSGRNHYNPVYHYQGRGQYSNQMMMPDGRVLGPANQSQYNVPKDALTKPVPTVRRTVSRGGFGSQAAAKSNWGGSSRRSSGWGG